MLDFPRWKVWLVCLTLVVCCAYSIPSFFPKAQVATWPSVAQARFNLGLDLAGGSHLMLEADTADALADALLILPGSCASLARGHPKTFDWHG